jgi:hypothetical protein
MAIIKRIRVEPRLVGGGEIACLTRELLASDDEFIALKERNPSTLSEDETDRLAGILVKRVRLRFLVARRLQVPQEDPDA